MIILGVESDQNSEQYFDDTEKRFSENNIVRNPFSAEVHQLPESTYIFMIKPLYPPFLPCFGGFLVATLLFAFGLKFSVLMILGLVLLSTGIFWTKYFFFFMLRAGMKKVCSSRIKLLDNPEIIKRLIGWRKKTFSSSFSTNEKTEKRNSSQLRK